MYFFLTFFDIVISHALVKDTYAHPEVNTVMIVRAVENTASPPKYTT